MDIEKILYMYEDDYNPSSMVPGPRNMYAGGQLVSQLVTPNPDGSRPGYAPVKGWKEEKAKFFKWLADNPDYDFASSSTPEIIKKSGTKFEVGTIQKFLNEKGIQTKHSIARQQETPKYTKKVLAELREGLPKGISIEETRPGSGKYYFKIMLKGGKANKPTYRKSMVANEANKKLIIEDFNRVSKEYYPGRITDEEFKNLRLANKEMTTEQFAKFLDGEGKTTYLGDKWNKSSVSSIQNRLNIGKGTTGPLTIRTVDEAKKIINQQPGAKFFFMTNPTDSQITQYAANLVSQEKFGSKGGKKGFPIGSTKENKMFRNFYDSSLKADGRMTLLTDKPIDADGNVDWKMKDKDGVPAWKKAKFYDNKTGATYTWGKDYEPGDLRKQVDKAYGKGFFAKSVQAYDEQAKMNKMKFNGKSLNEWMREGLLKKEFELKFNRKPTPAELKEWYALRKPSFSFTEAHHVEGVGKNPFRMEVSYRAANRKQNDLLNKYKSGTLNKTEYIKAMENLSDTKGGIRYKTDGRFIGQTGTPENIISAAGKDAGFAKKQINNMLLEFAGTITDKCKIGNAEGGRIGFQSGKTYCLNVAKEGLEKGLKNGFKKGSQQVLAEGILKSGKFLKDAVSLRGLFGPAALGFTALAEAGVVSYGMLSGGKSFREAIGDSLFNYVVKGTDYEIDSDEEFIKRLKNIKTGPSGLRDFSDEEIGKMQYFKESLKDMGTGFNLYNQLENINQKIEDNRLNQAINPSFFSDTAFQLDAEKDKIQADLRDYSKTGTPQRVTDYFLSDAATAGADAAKKAELLARQDQLQDAGIGKFYQSPVGDEKRKKEAADIKFQLEQMYNPTKLDEFGEYFISRPKSEQSYIMGLGYKEGGIASLNVKK